MPTDINRGFDNGDLLRDIRQDILNPVTVKVVAIERDIAAMKPKVERSIIDINKDIPSKSLIINKNDGSPSTSVSLDGMFQEGSDLTIVDDNGKSFQKVTKLDIHEAKIDQINPGEVELRYEWDQIVPHHQTKLTVGKTGVAATSKPDALYFKGPDITVENTTPGITTVNIPPAQPLTVSIPGGSPAIPQPVPVTTIELEGESGGSVINNGKLTLHLSSGGGGIVNQNFKGFFSSLGDLISEVQDPINGLSYAFAKDQALGGKFYTPYFYVNSTWTELKQDPALTYSGTTDPVNHGVFSIKPNPGISVDANGQLNLDGLSTPQLPQYFVGFYPSISELMRQVPRPISLQSCAYVKGPAGGWLNYRAEKIGADFEWRVVAPLGSFSFVDEAASSYTQVYGIRKSAGWTVDSKGLLSFVGGGGVGNGLQVAVSNYAGALETHDIKGVSYIRSNSLVQFVGDNKEEIAINHPQRIINYNATWESNHNSQDYEGNIFYDETSRCWMGYSIPGAPGAVGAKWTRIAHEDMSLEVKDLVKRVPAKAKSVTAGIIGDNADWAYNGITFLDKDSDSLPDDIKTICGAYVTTVVQDKDAAGVTIPQFRMQTCVADKVGGATYARRLDATGSGGAAITWTPWVRTSFSHEDIVAHEKDPTAHKDVIKYHKVTSISSKFTDLLAQYGGPGSTSTGFLRGSNCDLIVDNYGFTQGMDYLEMPYAGKFRVKGEFFVSGYSKNNFPVSTWTITLIKESQSGAQALLGQYQYEHKVATEKYPPIFFIANDVPAEEGDKVYIRLQCPQSAAINTQNPHLYFVPLKSQIIVEDMGTLAGTNIGATYKKHLANLNTFGEIEVKAHYTDFDSNRTVRVYGDKVVKVPTEMKKLN